MKTLNLFISICLLWNSAPVFPQSVKVEEERYYIAAGDVLSINVFPATEFSREVTVQPDGTIEVPLIGSLKVEGYTADEIEKILISRFSKYVANPKITVNVRKFASSRIGVMGEIESPGYYPFVEGMKILDLITQAGGFKDYAKLDRCKIFRKVKDKKGNIREEVIYVNIEKIVEGDFRYNLDLTSGDIIYIPEKRFSKFTAWMSRNIIPWLTIITFGLVIRDRIR